jgi:DNA helicase HerA-like ATPase
MMMLGKIFGKVTTKEFKFLATSEIKKFEYVQIYHQVYDFVLAQILEIEKNQDTTTATCELIGYLDKDGKVKSLRIPLEPQSEVFLAQDELIKKQLH